MTRDGHEPKFRGSWQFVHVAQQVPYVPFHHLSDWFSHSPASQHTFLSSFYSSSPWQAHGRLCSTSWGDCPVQQGGSSGIPMFLLGTDQIAGEKCTPAGEWVTGWGGGGGQGYVAPRFMPISNHNPI